MDRLGPRTTFFIGLALSCAGFVGVGLNTMWHADALWYTSFVLMGAGGPGVFMGCLTMGEFYPEQRAVATSVMASMWDTSSVVFVLFQGAVFGLNVPLRTVAFGWAALCGTIGLAALTRLPSWEQVLQLRADGSHGANTAPSRADRCERTDPLLLPPPPASRQCSTSSTFSEGGTPVRVTPISFTSIGSSGTLPFPLSPSRDTAAAVVTPVRREQSPAGVPAVRQQRSGPAEEGVSAAWPGDAYAAFSPDAKRPFRRRLHYTPGDTLCQLMCRGDTAMLLTFMAAFNLRSAFYISTMSDMLEANFGRATADAVSELFNVAFPVGGLLTSVVASVVLQRFSEREDAYMALVLVMANVYGLLALLPFVPCQYAGALLFGPVRTLQWACYFHFLAKPSRYPASLTGRLLGYSNLVIAVVGDLCPYLLSIYVSGGPLGPSDDGPGHDVGPWPGSTSGRYFVVNLVLQAVTLACFALPLRLRASLRSPADRCALGDGTYPTPLASRPNSRGLLPAVPTTVDEADEFSPRRSTDVVLAYECDSPAAERE